MDNILKTLQDLEGVHGAVIADASGQILAFRAHAVYDQNLLQEVSRTIVSALDSIKLLHEDWESVTASYSEGKLLIRNLGAGTKGKIPQFTLTLIADSRLNPSFAGVAIRVAVTKIRTLLEASAAGSAPVSVSFSSSSPFFASSAPASQPMPASSPMMSGSPPMMTSAPQMNISQPLTTSQPMPSRAPSVPDVASSGLSWSGLGSGTSSVGGSGVAVADSASSAFLSLCTKQLARSVGPMAKLFVKESVRRVCPDRPFSRDYAALLVADLEKHIDDKSELVQFRQVLKSI